MTTKQIIETKYLPWLAANGITSIPKLEVAQWDPVPGFEPPLEIKWHSNSGSRLDQPAELIAADIIANDGGIVGKMRNWAYEVAACVGRDTTNPLADWNTAEPKPIPPTPGSMVGERFATDYVKNFAVDQSRAYFAINGSVAREGAIYTSPDGKRYMVVHPTPFAYWFMAL